MRHPEDIGDRQYEERREAEPVRSEDKLYQGDVAERIPCFLCHERTPEAELVRVPINAAGCRREVCPNCYDDLDTAQRSYHEQSPKKELSD